MCHFASLEVILQFGVSRAALEDKDNHKTGVEEIAKNPHALLLCVTTFVLGIWDDKLGSASAATVEGDQGLWPAGGLVMDSAGNLYGTTMRGGANDDGTVFKISATGMETVLYSFADGRNGRGCLVMDTAGNLYGTSMHSGANGKGSVFKISVNGTETVLHSFAGRDGKWPTAGLVMDRAGNLYGTTDRGGAHGVWGTVFKISVKGTETVLHSFAGSDGRDPGGLVMDNAGNLYGTSGGQRGYWGGVFKISPASMGTMLYSFAGYAEKDGQDPEGRLVMDTAGNLYGTTMNGGTNGGEGDGTVFKISPTGTETVLHSFGNRNGQAVLQKSH